MTTGKDEQLVSSDAPPKVKRCKHDIGFDGVFVCLLCGVADPPEAYPFPKRGTGEARPDHSAPDAEWARFILACPGGDALRLETVTLIVAHLRSESRRESPTISIARVRGFAIVRLSSEVTRCVLCATSWAPGATERHADCCPAIEPEDRRERDQISVTDTTTKGDPHGHQDKQEEGGTEEDRAYEVDGRAAALGQRRAEPDSAGEGRGHGGEGSRPGTRGPTSVAPEDPPSGAAGPNASAASTCDEQTVNLSDGTTYNCAEPRFPRHCRHTAAKWDGSLYVWEVWEVTGPGKPKLAATPTPCLAPFPCSDDLEDQVPGLSSRPDPTDYDALAAEALTDPVVLAAYRTNLIDRVRRETIEACRKVVRAGLIAGESGTIVDRLDALATQKGGAT